MFPVCSQLYRSLPGVLGHTGRVEPVEEWKQRAVVVPVVQEQPKVASPALPTLPPNHTVLERRHLSALSVTVLMTVLEFEVNTIQS